MTIEEIRKLLAAITPIWERANISVSGGGEVRPVVEFITKAPEIVAFLLGEIERQGGEIVRLADVVHIQGTDINRYKQSLVERGPCKRCNRGAHDSWWCSR